ncbi:MAG: tetratricopeptide repeat protein, partial [Campylobacterota bacterium]
KKDIDKGYTLLLLAIENDNLKAYYTLGKIYLSKTTKYHDETKAYNHFVYSANKGYAKSQNMLGKLFLFGITTEVDFKKALHYFKKASKQKYYDANCFIAYMYASGKGVFPNFGRAHVFAKDEYKKGNKLCKRVWRDYNLGKYPKDEGFKVGDYLKPVK